MRTLLMLMVHGERFPCLPTWCRVNNWRKIRKTLVIAVTGLSGKEFEEKNDCFKKVQKYFEEVNKS